MKKLPATGLPAYPGANGAPALVVCGESPLAVASLVESVLIGWKGEDLSWGFREFYLRRYSRGEAQILLLMGGLGSASVEVILQEATLFGVRRFLLSGTCGSLSRSLGVGSLVAPSRVLLQPGAYSEYGDETQVEITAGTFPLQASLEAYLEKNGTRFARAVNLSVDAFYGVGASFDRNGQPSYAGAPLKRGRKPKSLDLALRNERGAGTLDMEMAPFFALGGQLEGVEVACVKAVSNPIPWDASFDDSAVEGALRGALVPCVGFLKTLG